MVLALLRAYADKKLSLKNLKAALRKIEHFHFLFNAVTSQRSSGSIATTYSQHAIRLTNAKSESEVQSTLNSLFSVLSKKLPTFEEFEVKFISLSYLSNRTKNKAVVKYALCKHLGTESNGLKIDLDTLTIEHLIPEAEIKKGVSEEIVGNIGNLLLTDGITNAEELADKSAFEKIIILQDKGYPIKSSFIAANTWSDAEVHGRAKAMAKSLYEIVDI